MRRFVNGPASTHALKLASSSRQVFRQLHLEGRPFSATAGGTPFGVGHHDGIAVDASVADYRIICRLSGPTGELAEEPGERRPDAVTYERNEDQQNEENNKYFHEDCSGQENSGVPLERRLEAAVGQQPDD